MNNTQKRNPTVGEGNAGGFHRNNPIEKNRQAGAGGDGFDCKSMNNTPQCTCASFFTVRGTHKPDCPLSPINASAVEEEKYKLVCPKCGSKLSAFAQPNEPFKNDKYDYDQKTAKLYCSNSKGKKCEFRISFSSIN